METKHEGEDTLNGSDERQPSVDLFLRAGGYGQVIFLLDFLR